MKTKQVQYMPDDPVLVFRAALTVRRQMIVDQQEIIRRKPEVFNTPVIKNALKRSEDDLRRVTDNLRRVFDGNPPIPSERRAILNGLDYRIRAFQCHLNHRRMDLVKARNKYVMDQLDAALARMDDLNVVHPEHTFDLIGIF